MHVVLSGYYGFDNVGDEAILYSIIHALRNLQENVEITVLSNDPESTKETYDVNAVNRWKLQEVSTCLKQADGLISGGGSLLQDQTGMKSIPYYTGIIRIAMFHKKPVFVYAQGMGPITRGISKWLTKRTLNKVDTLTVRDKASKDLLVNIGVKSPINIVPDPVLGLNGASFHSTWLQSQTVSNSFVTVSVRDWPTDVPFKRKIAEALDRLAQNGNTIVFVPMHGEHDAAASREVAAMMTKESIISPADASIEEKIALIGESTLLIGMRLHSLIFSAIHHTPFIAISYDPKIDAFASICKQPVIGHVEKDNWNGESLFEKANHTLSNVAFIKDELKSTVQPYQKEAEKTAEMALVVFKK